METLPSRARLTGGLARPRQWFLGISPLGLLFAWQVLYPLNHLPSTHFNALLSVLATEKQLKHLPSICYVPGFLLVWTTEMNKA